MIIADSITGLFLANAADIKKIIVNIMIYQFTVYFTDESTLAAPPCSLRANFDDDVNGVVYNLLDNPQQFFVIILTHRVWIQDIEKWFRKFCQVLKQKGISTINRTSISDSPNAKKAKYRLHNDNSIDTIRFSLTLYYY